MSTNKLKKSPSGVAKYYWQDLGMQHDPFLNPGMQAFHTSTWSNAYDEIIQAATDNIKLPVIYGARGVGKTSFAKHIHNSSLIDLETSLMVVEPNTNHEQFITAINELYDVIPASSNSEQALANVERQLGQYNKKQVLIIDNAEMLTEASIIALMGWSMDKGVTSNLVILLVADVKLKYRLRLLVSAADNKKFIHPINLHPLSLKQTHGYIKHCLQQAGYAGPTLFTNRSIKKLHSTTRGLVENIDEVARKMLITKTLDGKGLHKLIHDHSLLFSLGAVVLAAIAYFLLSYQSQLLEYVDTKLTIPVKKHDLASTPMPAEEVSTAVTDAKVEIEELAVNIQTSEPPAAEESAVVNSVLSSIIEPDEILSERAEIILAESGNHYTIQLFAAESANMAREFIKNNGLSDQANYYVNKQQDKTWYSVILGTYKTKEAARLAVAQLPLSIRKSNPWIRRFGEIQTIIIKSMAVKI